MHRIVLTCALASLTVVCAAATIKVKLFPSFVAQMSTHPKDHTVQFKANSSPSPHPRLKDVSKRHFTLSWATLPVYVETSRWRYVRHLAVVVLVIGLMLATAGLITWEKRTRVVYDVMDVMIPMRDGIRLRTKLFIPANISSNLPFLFSRTPYGIPDHDPLMYVALSMYPVPSYQALLSDSFMRSGTFTNSTLYWEIIKEGFILVFQDIRGRYGSEGVFSLARAPRDKSYSNTIDEATDAYDTIDWLLNNVDSHNGKVGMWGVGYDAMMTVRAMLDPHPALVAASPQGTPADLFKNDDFAHNGAFRLSPAFGYVAEMERDGGRIKQTFNFTRLDNYEFFLHDLQYLKNADINYFNESIPTWNSFRNHPVYDTYWLNKSLVPYMTKAPPCPTLNVAGWFDAEDFNGSMTIYQGFEKYDTNNNNFLITGPWFHGGWTKGSFDSRFQNGSSLGPLEFGNATATFFRKLQTKFFTYYLKGKGTWSFPNALMFVTGSNEWREYASWPPAEGIKTRIYLRENSGLSFGKPPAQAMLSADDICDSYVSDPRKPVQYARKPMGGFWTDPYARALWKVEDQRFSTDRPDVAQWTSNTLNASLHLSGSIKITFWATTTGSDVDWVVKLIDVYPNMPEEKYFRDFNLLVSDEVLRARFRHGNLSDPVPVTPYEITQYEIVLPDRNHVFQKGHMIAVHIQSTWYPLIDNNPQKFVYNLFNATRSDFKVSTNCIYHSEEYPSHLEISIVP